MVILMKIGITGSIASGKSEVEKILKEKFPVMDLDIVSHKLLETTAREEVLEEFKTTDRKELASIVFNDKEKLKKLENIIHPKLKKQVIEFFKENGKEEYIFVSGALLFEAGFFNLFDKTIFIDAKFDLRLKRLQKRNGLDEVEALKRMNAQTQEAKSHADIVIENNGSIEELKKKVKELVGLGLV